MIRNTITSNIEMPMTIPTIVPADMPPLPGKAPGGFAK
jgi:hypothetical protein